MVILALFFTYLLSKNTTTLKSMSEVT